MMAPQVGKMLMYSGLLVLSLIAAILFLMLWLTLRIVLLVSAGF
jgi:hypothetical protein